MFLIHWSMDIWSGNARGIYRMLSNVGLFVALRRRFPYLMDLWSLVNLKVDWLVSRRLCDCGNTYLTLGITHWHALSVLQARLRMRIFRCLLQSIFFALHFTQVSSLATVWLTILGLLSNFWWKLVSRIRSNFMSRILDRSLLHIPLTFIIRSFCQVCEALVSSLTFNVAWSEDLMARRT